MCEKNNVRLTRSLIKNLILFSFKELNYIFQIQLCTFPLFQIMIYKELCNTNSLRFKFKCSKIKLFQVLFCSLLQVCPCGDHTDGRGFKFTPEKNSNKIFFKMFFFLIIFLFFNFIAVLGNFMRFLKVCFILRMFLILTFFDKAFTK